MNSGVPTAKVPLAAVPNWRGSLNPTLKKVDLDIINDASTAITKYEQGGYDLYGYGGYSNPPVPGGPPLQSTPPAETQPPIHAKEKNTRPPFHKGSERQQRGQGTLPDARRPDRERPA